MPRIPKKPHLPDCHDHSSTENDILQTSESPVLFSEIIHLILDNFSAARADEKQDLLNIAMVSKAWCREAQAKLFAVIHVNSADRCKFWSRKFKKSPHLGLLVRELRLSDPHDNCLERPYMRTQPAKALALACSNVRKVEVGEFKRWGQVEQRVLKSFVSVQELSLLYSPALSRTRDVPDLIYNLPKLCKFGVGIVGEDYRFVESSSVHEDGLFLREQLPPNGKPIQLSHITFWCSEYCRDLFLWMTGPAFDHSKLEHVTLSWRDIIVPHMSDHRSIPNVDVLSDFLRIVGQHLSSLSLILPAQPHPILLLRTPRIDLMSEYLQSSKVLNNLTQLRVLTIRIGKDVRYWERDVTFGLFRVLPILSVLEVPLLATINLTVDINMDELESDDRYQLPLWEILDSLLSGDRFPSLRSFNWDIQADHWPSQAALAPRLSESDLVRYKGKILNCLPGTVSKRNVVNVNLVVH
ncbi:hypothetical protein VNI00_004900 [Paramarasmius palmivorus]|uniref:F-box domain-containing protein n=1 Tax=Paramarasmius palmivorus TaxID=297713 RepID=A0AAW0DLM4_9AGAR